MFTKRLGIPLLVAAGLMLAAAGIAQAQLKATAEVDAWDWESNPPMYSHSLVALYRNSAWMPFWHELNFDGFGFDWQNYPWPVGESYPGGCTLPDQTPWEGVMDYALYHEDTAADNYAYGFQETRFWELAHCDRDYDNDFDNDDKKYRPPYARDTISDTTAGTAIVLMAQDVVTTGLCGGNCSTEIVTTLFVSLDTDCDGVVDADLRGRGYDDSNPNKVWTGVCFFAEAKAPPPDQPWWQGNPQARITAGGGQKTVNFRVLEGTPTLIELASFSARRLEADPQRVISWATMGVLGVVLLGVLAWRLRPARR